MLRLFTVSLVNYLYYRFIGITVNDPDGVSKIKLLLERLRVFLRPRRRVDSVQVRAAVAPVPPLDPNHSPQED